ncbi:MAG TPA: DEAD/DEAH box helicase [Leucothrix mucor]|nr:DEAD/DEAH box helicase [Leucothrix mucor]
MDKSYDALYQVYLKLPQAEQRVLQVLSVMFEPRKHTTFLELVEELNWSDSDGVPLARYITNIWRNKWLDASLITYNHYQLQCNLRIIEALTWETIQNNTFDEILVAVRKFFPATEAKRGYELEMSRPHYVEAQIRINLYQQDESALFQRLGVSKRSKKQPEEKIQELLIKVCNRFIKTDQGLFENIPDDVKYYVLKKPLLEQLYNPVVNNEGVVRAEKYFPELVKKNSKAVCVLVELRVFQGRFAEAESLLVNQETAQALALKAWISFLKGEQDQSLALYQLALDETKKGTRKRNIYLPGLSGIFHIIALMASGDTKMQAQALKQIHFYAKEKSQSIFDIVLLQLEGALNIQTGKDKLYEVFYLTATQYTSHAIQRLLQTLQWMWVEHKVDPVRRNHLLQDCFKAAELKLDWVVWQLFKLLPKDQKKLLASKVVKQSLERIKPYADDYLDLCLCIQKKPEWEIALDALEGISTTNEPNVENTDQTTRMSWRIYLGSSEAEVEPREQKLSKNGKWTLGRAVSLKKLYTEREEYEYLTEQDQRICNHIQMDSYSHYGYGRTDYELNHDAVFSELVGHPYVFLSDQLSRSVEVTKEEPRLDITEVGDRKSLKLQLIPYTTGTSLLYKESDTKLVVVEFNKQHQRIAEVLGEHGIRVPKKAKEKVMARIAQLAPLMTIHSDIAVQSDDIETVDAQQLLVFHLQPVDEGLRFNAYIQTFETEQPLFHAGEGGATVFAEINGKQVQTHRDLTAEKKKFAQVLRHCPALYSNAQQEWSLDDPEQALETLLQLQELGDKIQLEWPQGKKITLNHATAMSQMSLSIRKSQDWFALSGELKISDEQVLEMRHLMDLLKGSSGRFIPLGDNQFLALTEELKDRLKAINAYTSNKGQFHPLAIPAIDELSEGMNLKASKPWKDQLSRLQDSRKLKAKLPTTLQAELRDYQLEGFQWLARLAHWGAGACLADDMGLGKTMQALALILTRCKQGPTLILAPTSVCSNWEAESYRFAPTLKVKRFGSGDRQKMLDDATAFDLIICSYGLLQSEAERLTAVKWHTIVADEAQAIKNHQAKRTKAAMKLQADFKIITTGTPIENHLGELWSLFQFINAGLLGSLEQFNQKYALPIERDNSPHARQQLKNLIAPFILRRLKSDVLTELPPRTEITLKVALSAEEKALYEAIRQQAMENVEESETPGQRRMKILAEIMRLRRACCHPRLVMPDSPISSSKLEAFAEIIHDLRENNHKALVFSQFVGHLSLIREYLDKHAFEYQYLDGSTSSKKRQQAVNDFQAGEGDLFLISLKAGGSGLNLTAADYVIHLDPWWNPAVEDQASDRAHRIGQQRPVTIYRLVAENTIEEKIVSLHHQKRDLADSLLEGTEMSGKLSVEDILSLLKEE